MALGKYAVVGHVGRVKEDPMSAPLATAAFAALGQPTRLEVLRLLMRSGLEGLPAGAIAEAVNAPQNTLSAHLSILARAGLVRGVRQGRSIVYRADIGGVRDLIEFLVVDCCDGHPDLCGFSNPLPASGCGCGPGNSED